MFVIEVFRIVICDTYNNACVPSRPENVERYVSLLPQHAQTRHSRPDDPGGAGHPLLGRPALPTDVRGAKRRLERWP